MAISRISDLPQISNEWGTSDEHGTNMDKSLIEVSWLDDLTLGTYTSKSVRCGTLKDYLVADLTEQDEFHNPTFFYASMAISGHVGINEDIVDNNDIDPTFGLVVKGYDSTLQSVNGITISAGSVVEL